MALTRPLSLALAAAVPWLAYPAPLPWFMPVIMAVLLLRLPGAALVTGVIVAVAGGGMVLLAAVIAEAALLAGGRGRRPGVVWAIVVGMLIGVMTFAFMFVIPEFSAIDPGLKLLALGVRIVAGVVYGWLAVLLVERLRRAGIGRRVRT